MINNKKKKDIKMDINSIDSRLEQLKLMDDLSHAIQGSEMVYELSTKIRSVDVADIPSIIACCDKILQKPLSDRGNLFQITSLFEVSTLDLITFFEALLEKNMTLAVYNILVHQNSDNEAKPVGYQLAHGRCRDRFFEKIINKMPEDLAKRLHDTAFVIYLDEERTEAVEYDLLGDGVRYLL